MYVGGVQHKSFQLQVDSVEGDAVVNNRKNKIIVGYELCVRASWEGTLAGAALGLSTSSAFPISWSMLCQGNHDIKGREVHCVAPDEAARTRASVRWLRFVNSA